MTKGEKIAHAIKKECQRYSLIQWCDSWDIEDFERFIELGKNAFDSGGNDDLLVKESEGKNNMTHVIKILNSYADAIVDGRKTFEVRENDRGYNAGDKVRFKVVDSSGIQQTTHPLYDKVYNIIYVHSGLGLKDNYVVFSIEPQESEDKE